MSDIKLNIVRTAKDKIFDIVFLVLTLTIWGIIICLISRAPDIVPTHFGPSGKPDAYGSPTFILIPSTIMTVVALLCAFSIYLPIASINLPLYKGAGNAKQKKLGIILSRIIALFILGLMLFIAIYTLGIKNHESAMPILIIVGLIIGISLVFTIMMYRAK